MPPKAIACWARIISASEKPRSSMTRPSTMYMMPIFLWSTLVNHSLPEIAPQPEIGERARAARCRRSRRRMKVPSRIGSWSGSASSVRRPKISFWRSEADIGCCRGIGGARHAGGRIRRGAGERRRAAAVRLAAVGGHCVRRGGAPAADVQVRRVGLDAWKAAPRGLAVVLDGARSSPAGASAAARRRRSPSSRSCTSCRAATQRLRIAS